MRRSAFGCTGPAGSRLLALALAMGLTAPAAFATTISSEQSRALFEERWFADGSPWNVPIPPNAAEMPGSADFISAFQSSGTTININRDVWTPIVLYGDAATPRCDISEMPWRFEDFPLHPDFPAGVEFFRSKGDTDSSFCVYNESNQSFYNLFAARLDREGNSSRVRIEAGGVFPVGGAGWWDNSIGPWSGRASGASYCGGLVRLTEFASGKIDHALAMGWPSDLVRSPRLAGAFVMPARTSDGRGTDPATAVPMGARLQVDPGLTDEQLLDIGVAKGDLPIVHALQRYGAYVVDSSSAMAIYAESARGEDAPTDASSGNLPLRLLDHARFIQPQKTMPLDSRLTVGQPVAIANTTKPPRQCIIPTP